MIAKFKIWGQKMYIFTFHIVKNHTKGAVFSSEISMITNVILILYNSLINNKLILRDLRFRHHIACFCCICFCCVTALFWVSVIRSWMIQSFKWFSSIAVTHLLTVTCCHLLVNVNVLIVNNFTFKVYFHFFIIFNISIQCFVFKMSKNYAFVTG